MATARPSPAHPASSMKRTALVVAIKAKKGLETLDDKFVEQHITKVFSANKILERKFDASKDFSQFSRSKEYEELLKRVRKELRVVYGVFQQGRPADALTKLREATTKDEKKNILTNILASHTSTKERLPHYESIYAELCKRIKPKVVIDVGCGMNPLAYNYFVEQGYKPNIIASDISEKDMAFLQEAFSILTIPGTAIAMDLVHGYEKLDALRGDVILLLKLLDSLEEAHRHISYKIFEHIKTQWIVVSFPTKSIGGKKRIAAAGRTWFERMLKRKNLRWETFSVENELFYIIDNHIQ